MLTYTAISYHTLERQDLLPAYDFVWNDVQMTRCISFLKPLTVYLITPSPLSCQFAEKPANSFREIFVINLSNATVSLISLNPRTLLSGVGDVNPACGEMCLCVSRSTNMQGRISHRSGIAGRFCVGPDWSCKSYMIFLTIVIFLHDMFHEHHGLLFDLEPS